jgi:hypothetical protein
MKYQDKIRLSFFQHLGIPNWPSCFAKLLPVGWKLDIRNTASPRSFDCQRMGIEVINSGAFYGCSSLTDISVPPGVESIYYNAFSGCSALTRISIPNSVTYIESSVFSSRGNELTILSKEGSTAQNYAKNNEINFVALPYTRLVGALEPDFQYMGNAKIKMDF